MEDTAKAPVFGTAFWESFLPVSAPFEAVIRDAFADVDSAELLWEDLRTELGRGYPQNWLIRRNIENGRQGRRQFTQRDWAGVVSRLDEHWQWSDVVLGFIWRAMTDHT